MQIAAGELLALYSDGIPEAQCGEEFFDEERFQRVLVESAGVERVADVRRGVLERVAGFLAGAPRSDDLPLLPISRAAAAADTGADAGGR